MELLTVHSKGYPDDYLFSRVRGRKVFFITEWLELLYSPHPLDDLKSSHYRYFFEKHSAEGIGQWLTEEFQWIYYQMSRNMQIIFSPFFLYYEIKHTLFPCFRYGMRKDREEAVGKLLHISLLSDRVKTVLERRDVKGIEQIFLTLSARFKGLRGLFTAPDRFLTLEQKFMHVYLEHTVQSDIHPVLKQFFVSLIDIRNIRTLLKHVRWHIPGIPSFVRGGTIDEARCKKLYDMHDLSEIRTLVSRLTHMDIQEDDPAVFERALLRGLSKKVQKAGRDPLGVGLLLDYLWRCYIQALNIRIVLHRGDAKKEMLEGSLIYG
jgi:vacuolar-type H+-ATPase subunit C/Vma6